MISVSGGLACILSCSGVHILILSHIVGAAFGGRLFLCITVEDKCPGMGAGITGLLQRNAGSRSCCRVCVVGVSVCHLTPVMRDGSEIPVRIDSYVTKKPVLVFVFGGPPGILSAHYCIQLVYGELLVGRET